MINFERYKDELQKALYDFSKDTGIALSGWKNLVSWGMQEWKPEMIDIDEFILEHLKTEYKWLARDKDGLLRAFTSKPKKCVKHNSSWEADPCSHAYYIGYDLEQIFGMDKNDLFSFVSWDDDEPWSIDELKKLVDDDQ